MGASCPGNCYESGLVALSDKFDSPGPSRAYAGDDYHQRFPPKTRGISGAQRAGEAARDVKAPGRGTGGAAEASRPSGGGGGGGKGHASEASAASTEVSRRLKSRDQSPAPPLSGCYRRCKCMLYLAILVGVFCALVYLFGALQVILSVLLIFSVLFNRRERLLAWLVEWAIGKTPKAFKWSIDRIVVKPSFSWKEDAWGEIQMVGWTWHNPDGFEDVDGGRGYLLQIDRLTARLRFGSILQAIRKRHAIEVDMLMLEGIRFKTQRNEGGALNLWEALALHDNDVNIKAVLQHARRYGGGIQDPSDTEAPNFEHVLRLLPPVSTTATRKAANYWRPEWNTTSAPPGDRAQPLLHVNIPAGYQEYPIGDPRRRPRWGVPLRIDIKQAFARDLQVWILDLILLDHQKSDYTHATKVTVNHMGIDRARFERGDVRRAGSDDGIHGLFLGEIIWVLIAEAVPNVLRESSSSLLKTAFLGAGYGAQDIATQAGAKTFEFVHQAKHAIERTIGRSMGRIVSHHGGEHDCRLQVRLISGESIIDRNGDAVNVYARLELRGPAVLGSEGALIDETKSEMQMWTKKPKWKQSFELGPVLHGRSTLRISFYHRPTGQVVHLERRHEKFLGEIKMVVADLLFDDDESIDGEKVGWFPLNGARDLVGAAGTSSKVKLGIHLVNREVLHGDSDGHGEAKVLNVEKGMDDIDSDDESDEGGHAHALRLGGKVSGAVARYF